MNVLRHNYVLLVSMLAIVWLFSQCEEVDDTACPACPVVTAIQPTSGKAFETVTISGRNFGGFSTTLDQATIDGVALIPIETQSFTDTEMQFMLPAELANGNTAPMTVRINIGNLTSDEGEGGQKVFFTYAYPAINELIPEHGRVGDLIIIKGENFDTIPANNVIRFAGVKAQIEAATASELTVRVPQGVQTGNVQLNLHGFSVDGPVFSFNTVVAEELVPNHGRVGEILTVKGIFFNTEELLKNQ
ncbi:MAG: IPT/TIG domain-containing protein, partial [Bacteroidota bacterium]